MYPPIRRGNPAVPSAVVHIYRTHDILHDGAPPDGCVFIGPPHLPPAKQSLAWLTHHGYTVVRTEYFSDAAEAVARYPQLSLDIGDHVRAEGAAILASDPSPRVNESSIHRSTTGSQPFAFSVPRSQQFPPPTQAWDTSSCERSNVFIPTPSTGQTSSLHWNTREFDDCHYNNANNMGFSNDLAVAEAEEEDATPLIERAPMSDGHNRDISRSDFEALFRKTATLHDRLDQVLEQQQQKQSRTRSSWTEFVSLLSMGEEEEEEVDEKPKDFAQTSSNKYSHSTNPSTRGSFYQDYIPEGTKTTIRYELPESTYSLLISEPIFSVPFNVGLLASTLSLMCLTLVLLDEFDKKAPGNTLGLPAGLHPSVQVAQYLGIIIGERLPSCYSP